MAFIWIGQVKFCWWASFCVVSTIFFKKIKRTRGCDIGLSATSSDEISCGSSIQKFDRANSKKEMKIDSSAKISTDFLNENDA